MRKLCGSTRVATALLCIAVLSGCGNLAAVRDFSASSAKLTAYTDVTNRYVTDPSRILQQVPPGEDFKIDRAQIQALAVKTEMQKDSILKLHNVATGYMAALAKLAGEDSYNLSGDIDKVSGAIAASPELGITAEHAKAYGDIASRVTSWILQVQQTKDVKEMVNKYGDSMDRLLQAMEISTQAMQVSLTNNLGKINSYEATREIEFQADVGLEKPAPSNLKGDALKQYESDRLTFQRRREATLAWARRDFAFFNADAEAAVKSAASAVEGIKIVRKGHTDMRQNIEHLTRDDVTKLLKKATGDLRDIRDQLKTL